MRQQLDAWVDAHREEIVAETQAILQIPSVEDEATAGPGAPFGRAVADALEHTLALCEKLGMRTENFGGYAGHAEFGAGDEIVAMLGHLDVVPPGNGWTVEPWGALERDGFLWARGASDDKGPTYAALFGAKAVFDVTRAADISLTRRVRLIFGCDEESGWNCMAHYFGPAGQPKPRFAFTPDACFPLVYAEKGAFTADAVKSVMAGSGRLQVSFFQAGLRANMVPGDATAVLSGDAATLDSAARALITEPAISCEHRADELTIRATGKSAHGSTPQEGDNAAVKLLRALAALPDLGEADRAWVSDLIPRASVDGTGVGIAGIDEITGPLTCNLGVVTKEGGKVRATINVRYPATWDGEQTTARFVASLTEGGWQVAMENHLPPLYVPPDQEPVRTLLRVYREHTGDYRPPATMGGRTYATAVAPNGVAFGAGLPGDPEVAHQADERFGVERLVQCAKIYAHALQELATLPGGGIL